MHCLVLADVHGNQSALAAVLEDVRRLGGADELWFLGDAIGYGPDPAAILDVLAAFRSGAGMPIGAFVAGNHDMLFVEQLRPDQFSSPALISMAWTAWLLGNAQWAQELGRMVERAASGEVLNRWGIAAGPPSQSTQEAVRGFRDLVMAGGVTTIERDARSFRLVHGTLRDPLLDYGTRFQTMYEGSPWPVQRACKDELEGHRGGSLPACDWPVEIIAHTHVPLAITSVRGAGGDWNYEAHLLSEDSEIHLGAGPALLNPGSVGCPRLLAPGEAPDPRASYVLVDTCRRTARFRRVPWDGTALRGRMSSLPYGVDVLRSQWPYLLDHHSDRGEEQMPHV